MVNILISIQFWLDAIYWLFKFYVSNVNDGFSTT